MKDVSLPSFRDRKRHAFYFEVYRSKITKRTGRTKFIHFSWKRRTHSEFAPSYAHVQMNGRWTDSAMHGALIRTLTRNLRDTRPRLYVDGTPLAPVSKRRMDFVPIRSPRKRQCPVQAWHVGRSAEPAAIHSSEGGECYSYFKDEENHDKSAEYLKPYQSGPGYIK